MAQMSDSATIHPPEERRVRARLGQNLEVISKGLILRRAGNKKPREMAGQEARNKARQAKPRKHNVFGALAKACAGAKQTVPKGLPYLLSSGL
jgi:hypothetical protein